MIHPSQILRILSTYPLLAQREAARAAVAGSAALPGVLPQPPQPPQ